jgi:hypothetical protein
MRSTFTAFLLLVFLLVSQPSFCQVSKKSIDEEWVKNIAINLWGRVQSAEELEQITQLTKKSNDVNKDIVDYFMSSGTFYKHMEEQLRDEYLEGVSKANIAEYITDFYQLEKGRTSSIYYDFFNREFIHLFQLGQLLKGVYPDSFSVNILQRMLVDNYVYDQINMGVDNLVLSLFQHFMMRKPTHYELTEAKKMAEGNPGILFNKTGKSKADLLDIIFSSNNYYEGQVRYWYVKIRHEEPSTDEMVKYMPHVQTTGTPEKLIESLLLDQSQSN